MEDGEFQGRFEVWLAGGIATGQIGPDADRVAYMAKFATAQLEKAAETVRALRDTGPRQNWNSAQEDRRDARKGAEKAVRDLQLLGRLVPTIDGSDLGGLRSWLEEVGQAGRTAEATGPDITKFAIAHSRGVLHKALHSTFNSDRTGSWDQVRAKVVGLFLTDKEAAVLMDVVFGLVQERGEKVAAYCLRYDTAIEQAWPNGGLSQMKPVEDIVVKKFEDSLLEPLVRSAVRLSGGTSIGNAMKVARQQDQSMAGRLGMGECTHRSEEPMDVGALVAHSNDKRGGLKPGEIGVDATRWKQCQGELKSLRKAVAEQRSSPVTPAESTRAQPPTVVVQTAPQPLMTVSAASREPPSVPYPGRFQGRVQGRFPGPAQNRGRGAEMEKCTFCKKIGHDASICWEKKASERYRPSPTPQAGN